MDCFHVYLMRNSENEILHTFSSAARMAELAKCRVPALYESKCASFTLLYRALAHTTGREIDFRTFSRAQSGKWSCPYADFSLSHTGAFCAAAVSDAPCGIDIEEDAAFGQRHTPARAAGMRTRILTAGEETDGDFLALWTKKESLYKCYGSGGFSPRGISANAHPVEVFSVRPFGLTLAVCGEKLEKIKFFRLRGNKIEPFPPADIC